MRVVVTPEQERAVCEPVGPDGTAHVAYLSGPSEIALKKNGGWILLSVNSGRLEDAVEAVLSLRARDEAAVQTASRAAALVQDRLNAWPSQQGRAAGGRMRCGACSSTTWLPKWRR